MSLTHRSPSDPWYPSRNKTTRAGETSVKRKLAFLITAIIAITSFAFLAPSSAHASGPFPWKSGENTGWCVEATALSNGAPLKLYPCNNSLISQDWYVTASSYGPGWVDIIQGNESHGNYCVALPGDLHQQNATLYACNGHNSQAFRTAGTQYGYTAFENANGDWLANKSGRIAQGNPIVGWPTDVWYTNSAYWWQL